MDRVVIGMMNQPYRRRDVTSGDRRSVDYGSSMSPRAFCSAMLEELAGESHNDQWVRGAYAMCEMYPSVDARRFETILEGFAAGGPRTALAEGARWLLPRWRATHQTRLGDNGQVRARM